MNFIYDNLKYNINFNKFNIMIPSKLIGNIISKSIDKIKLYIEHIISELKENKIIISKCNIKRLRHLWNKS